MTSSTDSPTGAAVAIRPCALLTCKANLVVAIDVPVLTRLAVVLTEIAQWMARLRRVVPNSQLKVAYRPERHYRDARRYSPGVIPVARRKARVKLDCEPNRASNAILSSGLSPATIMALA